MVGQIDGNTINNNEWLKLADSKAGTGGTLKDLETKLKETLSLLSSDRPGESKVIDILKAIMPKDGALKSADKPQDLAQLVKDVAEGKIKLTPEVQKKLEEILLLLNVLTKEKGVQIGGLPEILESGNKSVVVADSTNASLNDFKSEVKALQAAVVSTYRSSGATAITAGDKEVAELRAEEAKYRTKEAEKKQIEVAYLNQKTQSDAMNEVAANTKDFQTSIQVASLGNKVLQAQGVQIDPSLDPNEIMNKRTLKNSLV